jgi:cobalt-zinc-cadmium efflux system protein
MAQGISAHNHTHAHAHQLTRDKLRLGFILTLAILAVEVAGGFAAHSLSLLSDAGHMLTDAAALGLAWFAAIQAERPADERRTFGYHRTGILTALINGMTLVVIAVVIVFEAYQRFQHPQEVAPGIMVVAAAIGILLNLYIVFGLQQSDEHNLNARAALLHILGDIGASLGVIIGAIAIAFTRAYWVDPLISVLIAVLVAITAIRLIGEAVSILMESAPRDLSLPDLVRDMLRVPGIRDVHDLHVWSITSGMLALSCHAVIDDLPPSGSAPILDAVAAMLRRNYRITHTTIQFESTAHGSHEGFCVCPPGSCDAIYCDLRPTAQHDHNHNGHDHSDHSGHSHVPADEALKN